MLHSVATPKKIVRFSFGKWRILVHFFLEDEGRNTTECQSNKVASIQCVPASLHQVSITRSVGILVSYTTPPRTSSRELDLHNEHNVTEDTKHPDELAIV